MSSEAPKTPAPSPVPLELELYINPDGSVTFADLAAELIPLAQLLNPEDELICEIADPNQVERE